MPYRLSAPHQTRPEQCGPTAGQLARTGHLPRAHAEAVRRSHRCVLSDALRPRDLHLLLELPHLPAPPYRRQTEPSHLPPVLALRRARFASSRGRSHRHGASLGLLRLRSVRTLRGLYCHRIGLYCHVLPCEREDSNICNVMSRQTWQSVCCDFDWSADAVNGIASFT